MSKTQLPRCTSESQGIPSAAISAFVEDIQQNVHELHSFMLLRHGAVVAEGWWSPYAPELPHMLFSLSKSFTSTAVGLAVAEGLLTVNDPVISFFPEDLPAEPSENLRVMRVKQLLSMSTGHAEDTTGRVNGQAETTWVKAFLALPVEFKPGTHFVYNTAATYMLSAIVQKVTGMTVRDYLMPRLFEPLGISKPFWESSPEGINTGGWGLNLTTEDIARFGQLYLQKGKWEGSQIVPEVWVAEATSRQVSNGCVPESDWDQGYAYQFWRCRHGAYRGDGAFGQYCIVMPEQDAVLAITSGLADMQQVLNIAWERLLPAMGPAPLVANEADQHALREKLAGLKLVRPAAAPAVGADETAAAVSGKQYTTAENGLLIQCVSFDFSAPGCTLRISGSPLPGRSAGLRMGGVYGEQQLVCGSGAWHVGETDIFGLGPQQVYASGIWTAADTYEITARLVRTPFFFTFVCRFTGSAVEIRVTGNVAFEQEATVAISGHAE